MQRSFRLYGGLGQQKRCLTLQPIKGLYVPPVIVKPTETFKSVNLTPNRTKRPMAASAKSASGRVSQKRVGPTVVKPPPPVAPPPSPELVEGLISQPLPLSTVLKFLQVDPQDDAEAIHRVYSRLLHAEAKGEAKITWHPYSPLGGRIKGSDHEQEKKTMEAVDDKKAMWRGCFVSLGSGFIQKPLGYSYQGHVAAPTDCFRLARFLKVNQGTPLNVVESVARRGREIKRFEGGKYLLPTFGSPPSFSSPITPFQVALTFPQYFEIKDRLMRYKLWEVHLPSSDPKEKLKADLERILALKPAGTKAKTPEMIEWKAAKFEAERAIFAKENLSSFVDPHVAAVLAYDALPEYGRISFESASGHKMSQLQPGLDQLHAIKKDFFQAYPRLFDMAQVPMTDGVNSGWTLAKKLREQPTAPNETSGGK